MTITKRTGVLNQKLYYTYRFYIFIVVQAYSNLFFLLKLTFSTAQIRNDQNIHWTRHRHKA